MPSKLPASATGRGSQASSGEAATQLVCWPQSVNASFWKCHPEIDEAEPGRYLQVPRADSSEGYDDMQDFIDTLSDEHLQESLNVAIQGRGALRRFKDVLARHPAEQQRWFDFQAARLDARAREWLAEEGLSSEPA